MNFRFKDKEKPRNYTCGLAGTFYVSVRNAVLSVSFNVFAWRNKTERSPLSLIELRYITLKVLF